MIIISRNLVSKIILYNFRKKYSTKQPKNNTNRVLKSTLARKQVWKVKKVDYDDRIFQRYSAFTVDREINSDGTCKVHEIIFVSFGDTWIFPVSFKLYSLGVSRIIIVWVKSVIFPKRELLRHNPFTESQSLIWISENSLASQWISSFKIWFGCNFLPNQILLPILIETWVNISILKPNNSFHLGQIDISTEQLLTNFDVKNYERHSQFSIIKSILKFFKNLHGSLLVLLRQWEKCTFGGRFAIVVKCFVVGSWNNIENWGDKEIAAMVWRVVSFANCGGVIG